MQTQKIFIKWIILLLISSWNKTNKQKWIKVNQNEWDILIHLNHVVKEYTS